jgi:hypothetical protein
VVAVAGRGPGGDAIDVVVGEGDAIGGVGAEDDVLAADEGGLSWWLVMGYKRGVDYVR